MLFILCVSPVGAAANPVRLLALGDSLTQGYGLPQGEGLVPQLQAWLKAQGADVQVINGGVSGDTTAGGLARVDWSLSGGVDAMMVILGGNDLLRGIPPSDVRDNLDGILKAGQKKGIPMLLVGIQASKNYGELYKKDFDSIYPDLARDYDTLFVPSFYAALTGGTEDASRMRQYLQADGLHPNAEGVQLIVAAFGPEVLKLVEKVKAPVAGN